MPTNAIVVIRGWCISKTAWRSAWISRLGSQGSNCITLRSIPKIIFFPVTIPSSWLGQVLTEVDVTTNPLEKQESNATDGVAREKIVNRFKAMNKTGNTGDDDPLADRASEFLYKKLLETSLEDSIAILSTALEHHHGDVNFDNEIYNKIQLMVSGPEAYGQDIDTYDLDCRLEAVVIKYHSPYPEVRAVTDPFDTDMPVETIRAYILGAIWVAVGSFINEFFTFRQPALSLGSTVIQLFLYPCGKFTELLPDWGFTFMGTRYSINPGPWSIKEQMLATIMVNCGAQASNWMSMTVTLRSKLFFGYEWVDFGFVWLMNFASLFFGYGLAGVMRKLVIFPVKAVFPNVLPTLALSRALVVRETKSSVNGWTISRQKFFFLTFGISFCYFWVPNFLFKALSTFNWMTWIAPKNVTLAMATGSFLGFGVNPLPTFDWAVVNYSAPLVYPFVAFMNKFIGVLLSGIIMVILYWRNYKFSGYLPMNVNTVYDRYGKTYNVSKIVVNNHLVEELYQNYSPPYMSAGNLVGKGGLWAVYTCTFVYIVISEHKLLWETLKKLAVSIRHPFRKSLEDFDDPHSRMMSRYPEVPDWWYITVFLIGAGTGLAAILAWPTTVPVWTVIMIFFFNIAMYMPTLVVMSRTGYSMGFGAFSVILAGFMDPGNAVTNIVIRMWGYNIDDQSETFIGDQKLAHYAKIPQRATFRAQLLATLIESCCTAGAVEALFSPTQVDKTVYSDAIMFGVINPTRNAFWIGAVIALKWPQRMKGINPALMGYGTIFWGVYMNYFFMYFIRRRYTGWWTKYNYILTSGLSAGIAFAGIIIFAGLQYKQVRGVDYAPEGFGLKPGEFS
ncbi:OPT oligopeptide transporter protein-domain-containing protein [Lipomyces doorenjongii]